MNIPQSLLAVSLSSLLLACSGSDGAPESADAGPSTDAAPSIDAAPESIGLEELCGEDGAFVALVEKFGECIPEFIDIAGGLPSVQGMVDICTNGNQPYLDDGSLALGPRSELEQCLASIESASCTTYDLDFLDGCDGVLVGQVAAGGACDSDTVCEDGFFCDTSGTGDCGFCAVEKPEGASCDDNGDCAEGICQDGTCLGDGLQESPCSDNDHCRGRLVCDGESEECTDPASYSEGDACTSFDGQCGFPFSGLYCAPGETSPSCQPFRALGEDCDPSSGIICDLLGGLTCDTEDTGTCVESAVQADGESCDLLAGTICMSGSGCDEGTCRAYAAIGESCVDGAEVGCDLLLECVDGTCQAGEHTGLCSE